MPQKELSISLQIIEAILENGNCVNIRVDAGGRGKVSGVTQPD